MKIKKILAALLAVVMLLALVPAAALAADDEDEGGEPSTTSSGVDLSKTAALEDDGTYTITLEAYATGEVKTTTETAGVPCDIVLVLDQSSSMSKNMYTYTAQPEKAYTYSSYGYGSQTYYYQDGDGNYYEVSFGKSNGNGGRPGNSTTYYYLSYTKNEKTYYLTETGPNATRPTNATGQTDTMWTGVLYTRTDTNTTRLQALKDAANAFITQVQKDAAANNVDHKIAVVGFGSSESTSTTSNYKNTELLSTSSEVNYSTAKAADYQAALVSANDNGSVNTRLTDAITRVDAGGNTYANLGLEMAQEVLDNRTEKTYTAPDNTEQQRKTIVVFFTDGVPGKHTTDFYNGKENNSDTTRVTVTVANDTIEVANSLKAAGTTVYSVGVIEGADPAANYNFTRATSTNDITSSTSITLGYVTGVQAINAYLHFVSSDYAAVEGTPTMETYDRSKVVNNGYYLAASSADELSKVFETISSSIGSSSTTCTLNENSVLKDVIGSRFALPEGFTAENNVTVQTADYQGNGKFGTAQTLNGATVTVEGKTISVSGFDYSSNYVVDASGTVQAGGQKLIVTIKGVLPTDDAVTGEAVNTNARTSGIYADASATTAAAVFPQPKTILTSKTYVLDYAKTATLTGLDQTPSAIVSAFQAVDGDDTSVAGAYGSAALNGSSITYTPKTTNWNGYDSFYVFGQTNNTTITSVDANNNGNLWSKVSVLPANSVYYEDDFITSTEDGTVGIKYSGTWTVDGTSAGNTETANNPVHGGWVDDTGLSDDNGYSDGSAHKAVASADNTATATFTFTGTGVDIYSYTDMTTGTILVILTGGPEGNTVSKALSVDNKAVSGKYYQIPTATFDGLEYGTYTVTLYVTTAAASEGRYTYYLDGIRVYNPIQELEETDTVQAAYGDELGAVFTEVRDLLESGHIAFIDEGNDENGVPTKTSTVGDYKETDIGKIAPEHEIYLAPGQSVVISATVGSNYYIGLKSPTGSEVTAEISSGIYEGTNSKSELTISHTTDLYYKVTPNTDGTIIITNSTTGSGDETTETSPILSITKLRVTGSDVSEPAALSDEQAIQAYTAFQSYALVAYSAAPVTEEELPDTAEPETPDEEEPGDVVIENPDDPGDGSDKGSDKGHDGGHLADWLKNLFENIKRLFRP